MKDCRDCKKLKRYDMLERARKCSGFATFDPPDIIPCPKQIEWILENRGHWVSAPSGYTDAPIYVGRGKSKPPTNEDIVEIERRLEHCGLDGLMVILYYRYRDECDEYFLSRYYRTHEAEIRRMIEATILHISGHSYNEAFKYNRYRAERDYFRWQKRG